MAKKAKTILVPINGGEATLEAFRLGCSMSRDQKAKLYALHVIEVKNDLPVDAEVDASKGEAILVRIEAVGADSKCQVQAKYLQARRAGPAIVQEASNREVALIVLGIPYKRKLGRFVIGETASYILKNALCPVILWREQVGPVSETEE